MCSVCLQPAWCGTMWAKEGKESLDGGDGSRPPSPSEKDKAPHFSPLWGPFHPRHLLNERTGGEEISRFLLPGKQGEISRVGCQPPLLQRSTALKLIRASAGSPFPRAESAGLRAAPSAGRRVLGGGRGPPTLRPPLRDAVSGGLPPGALKRVCSAAGTSHLPGSALSLVFRPRNMFPCVFLHHCPQNNDSRSIRQSSSGCRLA